MQEILEFPKHQRYVVVECHGGGNGKGFDDQAVSIDERDQSAAHELCGIHCKIHSENVD